MKITILLLFFLYSTLGYSEGENQKFIHLLKHQSSMEFTAVGNPSMLTIKGESDDLSGILQMKLLSSVPLKKFSLSGIITFNLRTLHTGIDLRDKHMKEKYLETEKDLGKYTICTLKLTSLELPNGNDKIFKVENVPFEAELTLHGQEKMIKGVATLEKLQDSKESKLKGVATFSLKMSDYGMAIPNYAGIVVGEEVQIKVILNGIFSKEG